MVGLTFLANQSIKWRIDSYPSNRGDFTELQIRDAVKKGMALWENELRNVAIKFEEITISGEPVDLVIEWIIFDPEFLKNFIGRENLALREINNQTGEIRIQCNALLVFPFGEYTIRKWAAPRTTEKQVDVQDIIAHEVGHALGLTTSGRELIR